jgi:hypothetical protein
MPMESICNMYIVRNCDLDALFCLNSSGTLVSLPLLFSVKIMQCIYPQSVVTVGSDLGGHDDHCATLKLCNTKLELAYRVFNKFKVLWDLVVFPTKLKS